MIKRHDDQWIRLPGGPAHITDQWTLRGREFGRRMLAEGAEPHDLLGHLRRPPSIDLNAEIGLLTNPDLAERRAQRRTAFYIGVVQVAVAAGGLRLGHASRSDPLAPMDVVVDEHLRHS